VDREEHVIEATALTTRAEGVMAFNLGFKAGCMNRHNGYVCYGDEKKPTLQQVRAWAELDIHAMLGYNDPQIPALILYYMDGYFEAFRAVRAEYKTCPCANCKGR
jgi:hypothetical protein